MGFFDFGITLGNKGKLRHALYLRELILLGGVGLLLAMMVKADIALIVWANNPNLFSAVPVLGLPAAIVLAAAAAVLFNVFFMFFIIIGVMVIDDESKTNAKLRNAEGKYAKKKG